jgi:protein-L-isoaspartate(D-aspartate) O-methyltransferase
MKQTDFRKMRAEMVDRHIVHRGVRAPQVLEAMRNVPRERFLPEDLQEFAYEDAPLPIAEGQTISQPYIVAMMTEALALEGGERVLEIGTGSGYAAAVLAEIAKDVYTVERIGQLAEKSAAKLASLGYGNVHVLHGDGTRGWPEHAPYDAIIVAAGGPQVPESLKAQLKIGGRLVIPVGADRRLQELVRVTRVAEHQYTTTELADVRFVPLVGEEGWAVQGRRDIQLPDGTLAQAIAKSSEKFTSIDSVNLEPMLRRIGDARIVLLGESTHGTSEFYRMRERITRELIEKKGFAFIAIEGDWPDAARIDHYVRHSQVPPSEWTAFARFPVWMWRNREVREFVDWLRARNADVDPGARVAFHGLDLYSLYSSIRSVLEYLDRVDPKGDSLRPVPDVRAGGDLHALGSDAKAPSLRRTRWRALPGCRAERPPGRQRGALLSDHVLRIARLVESARQPHVRDIEESLGFPRAAKQRHRMGAQFPRGRFRGDGDVGAG